MASLCIISVAYVAVAPMNVNVYAQVVVLPDSDYRLHGRCQYSQAKTLGTQIEPVVQYVPAVHETVH